MKIYSPIYLLFVLGIQNAHCATSEQGKIKELYCTGKSYNSQLFSGETPTEALVKLTEKNTYVEINAVGFGQSQGKMKMVSSMAGIGKFTMQSAATDFPPQEAGFNLNIYSGELVVYPATSNGGKAFFTGTCKATKPLL